MCVEKRLRGSASGYVCVSKHAYRHVYICVHVYETGGVCETISLVVHMCKCVNISFMSTNK